MSKQIPKLHDAISRLLSEKLKKHISATTKLNRTTCTLIFSDIFDTLVEVITTANVKLTNESVNYLAQQYYDGILINNQYELDPNIFEKRAKLEEIETKELALLAVMLNHTDFAIPIINEIKRRS